MHKQEFLNNIKKIFVLILTIGFVCTPVFGNVFARTANEIQQEIDDQKSVLDQKENEKNLLQLQLDESRKAASESTNRIDAIEFEIKSLEIELELATKQSEALEQSVKLQELFQVQLETEKYITISNSYKDWRSSDPFLEYAMSAESDSYKAQSYYGLYVSNAIEIIISLTKNLDMVRAELAEYMSASQSLSDAKKDLEFRKSVLEQELALVTNTIVSSENNLGLLERTISQVNSQISSLSLEQKQALEEEERRLNNNGSNGGSSTPPPVSVSGSVGFSGTGRDARQGHGVGMSQWGAHGLAKQGMSAAAIVQFYFTGVQLSGGFESTTIPVIGYGDISVENYVAGQAEVPSKACGNESQVSQNPAKYVLDNVNTEWDCWPEEAIKAQAIIFRTYALNYVQRTGQAICTTATCQVFNGSTSSAWAAEETRGIVATSGNVPIEALYSSDNSQGFGTANNDTIWQGFDGVGSVYSYLRAVNDTAAGATPTGWTYWSYSTESYTMEQIQSMLVFASTNGNYSAGIRAYVSNVLQSVGSLTSIQFELDPSARVKKVILSGTNGSSVIGGSWFKNIWNIWVDSNGIINQSRTTQEGRPVPDYIYSLTFRAY